MFCICIHNELLSKVKKLNYIPVGLGDDKFDSDWKKDNLGENISEKNKFYGEYTFHYWFWKNHLHQADQKWIGFCQYRKFWLKNEIINASAAKDNFKKDLLKEIPIELNNYESILGEPFYINQFKLMKFIKKDLSKFVRNPSLLFDKNKRNIKFHFDLMHGDGNLDKAIKLLDDPDRKDFSEFVNREVSFNPHNMFICKNYKILEKYYNAVFPWLERCEAEFGFDLEGYGLRRIYGFLAERYMSFWFQKYTKYKTLPIVFKDISELN